MPAVSKSQQKLMGMVHAAQKGELKHPSKKVAKMAATMPKNIAKKFAATKLKGLPSKVKEEEIQEAYDNAVGNVHTVLKAYPGCNPEMLVKEIDPIMGAKHHGIDHQTIHGVYGTADEAKKIAEKVYKGHLDALKMLEEKKGNVADKLTKKVEELEKERTEYFKTKDYEKESKVAKQIQHFMDLLKKVEKSKKEIKD